MNASTDLAHRKCEHDHSNTATTNKYNITTTLLQQQQQTNTASQPQHYRQKQANTTSQQPLHYSKNNKQIQHHSTRKQILIMLCGSLDSRMVSHSTLNISLGTLMMTIGPKHNICAFSFECFIVKLDSEGTLEELANFLKSAFALNLHSLYKLIFYLIAKVQSVHSLSA